MAARHEAARKRFKPPIRSRGTIHPRVVRGRTKHPKVNTSSRPDPNVRLRKIAAIEAHLEEHPTNGVAQKYLDKLTGVA